MKRLRLKSVYTRYMLIFMTIMFFTVAILGILVTTIVGNYATETKKKEKYKKTGRTDFAQHDLRYLHDLRRFACVPVFVVAL